MKSLHRLAAWIGAAFLACALWPAAQPAFAQAIAQGTQGKYPNKPVRFVVPYAPGGLPDTVARILGKALGDKWGQQVLIDNRPGGNGVVSAQFVASSAADGYTLLVTDNSMFSINPALYPKLPYDPKRDFVPVSLTARAPLYLAINPSIPANTLQEFVALVKANPGKYSYGSSGIGSTHHLCTEAMKATLGLNIVHVPFKGTGQSVPAVVAGDVAAVFSAGPSVFGFAKTGKIKLIGVNSAKRATLSPNLPTIAETLIPGFDFAPTIGVFAAAGTPADIVRQVSEDVAQVVKVAAVIEQMQTLGIDPVGGSAEEYAALLKEDTERYAKAVKAAGVKME
jgi:tripartite-type tricarboxylate transporter receptor subunit TctC